MTIRLVAKSGIQTDNASRRTCSTKQKLSTTQGNEELLRAFKRYMFEDDLYQTEKFQDTEL